MLGNIKQMVISHTVPWIVLEYERRICPLLLVKSGLQFKGCDLTGKGVMLLERTESHWKVWY